MAHTRVAAVKTFVVDYMKKNGITQTEVGKRLAIGRQTVSNILNARNEYFNEKHAVLFGLAYGFRKEFLMKGEGEPFEPSGYNAEAHSALDIILNLLKETNEMLLAYNQFLMSKTPCTPPNRDILRKFNVLYSFFNTALPLPSTQNVPVSDYAQSAETVLRPLMKDLESTLKKEC